MTPFSIMFSRTGTNENCAEFLPYHFVPIIQDGRKMLVKRMHLIIHIQHLLKQASSLYVLKSKVDNTHNYPIQVVQKF